MGVTAVQCVGSGDAIVTSSSNGRFPFLNSKKQEERTLVLGTSRGGAVPICTKDPEDGSNRYRTAGEAALQNYALADQVEVQSDVPLSVEEGNIRKLWDYDGLWELDESSGVSLKVDSSSWVSFDSDRHITTISSSKPDSGPWVELKPIDKYHLGVMEKNQMPISFYYQLEVFNWLLLELRHKLESAS